MRSDLGHYSRIISEIYREQAIRKQRSVPLVRIPEKIRSIRSLEKGVAGYRQPRERIFVHQARLMEDYEDDLVYDREILKIYPTYQSLNDEQLRGYFGWRSRVRQGDITRGTQAYAHLYIYELLNLIGANGPADAFCKLKDFMARYRKFSRTIVYEEERWLTDFVVYYGLDPGLLEGTDILAFDSAASVLLCPGEHNSKEIFDAVWTLSGCRKDLLPVSDQDLLCETVSEGYLRLWKYYEEHRKTKLAESYLGKQASEPVHLFETAVVYCPRTDSSFDYELSPVTTYHCEKGKWSVRSYKRSLNNPHFLRLLQTADAALRENSSDECFPELPRWYLKLIKGAAADTLERRRQEEALRVEIDVSLLDRIRLDAAGTRSRLLTAEEMPEPKEIQESEEQSAQKHAAGFEDEMWRMFNEYSEEDSTDTDQLT